MKIKGTKKSAERGSREMRGAFLGIAAALLAYLFLVCAVKGIGFAMVWITAAALLLSAGIAVVAARLME